MGFGIIQLSFKEQKIDGNVLERVCLKLPCIGREEECGVVGCYLCHRPSLCLWLSSQMSSEVAWGHQVEITALRGRGLPLWWSHQAKSEAMSHP